MEDKKSILKYLSETITQVFTYALLGSAISGWIMERFISSYVTDFADMGFFIVGSGGIMYESIFQIFALSVVLGVLLLIFVSDFFLSKYMLLWRHMIFLCAAVVAILIFVLIFKWFPADIWQGWVALISCFIILSSASMIPSYIRIKREDAKYEEALSDYKSKKAAGTD